MGRLSSVSLSVAFIIICGQLAPRTDATFFIETHNDGIRLYECNATSGSGSPQASGSSAGPPPSYTTNRDIRCVEVTDRTRKQEIYSTTNFFLVVNARLRSGRHITVGSRSAELPLNIFVGVTIVGVEAVDYPALVQDLDASNHARMRNKCMASVPTRHLSSDLNFEAFGRYMGTADFHRISHYLEPSSHHFGSFNEIMGVVQEAYEDKVSDRARSRVSISERREVRGDVKSAVGFLIQKLIDPCFIMSHVHEELHIYIGGRYASPVAIANMLCKYYCRLLRTTTKLYSEAPSCGHGLHDGVCQNGVCKCNKKQALFACTSGPPHLTMIKCSNDVRTGLARSVDMGV